MATPHSQLYVLLVSITAPTGVVTPLSQTSEDQTSLEMQQNIPLPHVPT